MDALQAGLDLHRAMVDAWLKAALVSFQIDGDKDAMHEFRAAFGRNPKHIIKAVERFPDVFKPENEPDLYDVLATILLSKVKDDELALGLFDKYKDEESYDELRAWVKDANGHAAPRKPSLAERIAEKSSEYDVTETDPDSLIAFVLEQPEVAAALAKRNATK